MPDCIVCTHPFVAKRKTQVCCSPTCLHTKWQRDNRAEYNAYQKEWRAAHRESTDAYNKARRRPQRIKTCLHCNKYFPRKVGSQKFCSTSCRNKHRWQKPEERAKAVASVRRWIENNREKHRTYARAFYRRNKLDVVKTQPWALLLKGAAGRARKNKLSFNLDDHWAMMRWNNRCEMTGIEFSDPETRNGPKNKSLSPSIDRKIPTLGYTKDTCRFVLWAVNSFKQDGDEPLMFKIAKALLEQHGYTVTTSVSSVGITNSAPTSRR